jgi:hypothetical protein
MGKVVVPTEPVLIGRQRADVDCRVDPRHSPVALSSTSTS